MTLDGIIARHDLRITGVIHVGAHLGEEAPDYAAAGIPTVWWVEGNPDIIPALEANVARYGHRVICAVVSEFDDEEVTFNVTNYESLSSSILQFGTHRQVSPDVHWVEHKKLRTKTLDRIVRDNGISGCNFLNMDLQGAELLALRGGEELLRSIDYIFTEINVDELYIGCARLPQLDDYLARAGFARVAIQMAGSETNWVGWGDALYIRKRRP
jgi:FkbM family methyltransferase